MNKRHSLPLLLLSCGFLLAGCGGSGNGGSSSIVSPSSSVEPSVDSSLSSSKETVSSDTSIEESSILSVDSSGEISSDLPQSSEESSFDPIESSSPVESSAESSEPIESSLESSEPIGSSEESSSSSNEDNTNVVACTVNGITIDLENIHPDWDDYVVYSISLFKDDKIKFTLDGETLHFYVWPGQVETDLGEEYVAPIDGDYIFGINPSKQVWLETPEGYSNIVTCKVNDAEIELVNIHPDGDDYGVYLLSLNKGDTICFFLDYGALHFYQWPDGVETDLGTTYTILYDGDYTFGVNAAGKVWFEMPAKPVLNIVTCYVNGVEVNFRNIHPDWPDYSVFFLTLAKGDKVKIYLDDDQLHFYKDSVDIGDEYTAIREGEYLFGVNTSKQIWFNEADPVISATLNSESVSLVDIGSSSDEDRAVYRLDLKANDKVCFFLEETPLHFYTWPEGNENDLGTEYVAPRDGEYLFGVKKDNKIWFVEPSL